MITAVCPCSPDHKKFSTCVLVMEEWQVDEHGDFLKQLVCLETVHGPNAHNTWTCCECGADAVITSS